MDESERDSDHKSQGSHQSGGPSGDGVPDGPAMGPEPEPHDLAQAAIDAHLGGIPDSLPPQWCSKCEAFKKPIGKGNCEGCGRMLKYSFTARKRPVNRLRVQQLLEQFIQDYRPSTQHLRSMCEWKAGTDEQLETMKPGSQEHKRLIELSLLLGDALEASRPARQQTDVGDLSALSVTQLLASSERNTAMLRQMLEDEQRTVPPPEVASRFDGSPFGSQSPVADSVEPVTSEPDPAPERICRYCYQSPARCAETKTTHLDAWRAFHHDDPSEVERRDAEATQVMLKMMRFGNPY